MLIDFAVKNFRSIKDRQVFSLQPRAKVKEIDTNIGSESDIDLLKTAIIYGRNGGGKSNLLKAIFTLSYLVQNSVDFKSRQIIFGYDPYKLDIESQISPVEFEINFIAKNGLRYNYFISFNKDEIIKETLYFYTTKKPTKIFIREIGKEIDYGTILGNNYKEVENTLYQNQLFLSKVGKYKIDSLSTPYDFFNTYLITNILHNPNLNDFLLKTIVDWIINDKTGFFLKNINTLLKFSDLGIKGVIIKVNKEEDFKFPENFNESIKKKILDNGQYQIRTLHDFYIDGKINRDVEFDISEESEGTKKLLAISGLLINILSEGGVMVIDELDKSLHPMLTKAIIKLFNNPKTNPNNAQLIFASHDVSLLDNTLFRRDQIWFAEKNEEGSSEYYSIADIQNVRKDVPYDKWYLSGRFNAIPVINDYNFDFQFD